MNPTVNLAPAGAENLVAGAVAEVASAQAEARVEAQADAAAGAREESRNDGLATVDARDQIPAEELSRIEARTREVGQRIMRRAEKHDGQLLAFDVVQDRVMNHFLADDEVRVQLLRFVEAYPAYSSFGTTARHLGEYVTPQITQAPWPLKLGRMVSRAGRVGGMLTGAGVAVGVRNMAGRFICGETGAQAQRAVARLARKGMMFTVDLLGEEVLSEHEAEEHTEQYLAILNELGRSVPAVAAYDWYRKQPTSGPLINVSIKLSALTSHFDPICPEETAARVMPRLVRIVRRARELGAFINVDVEQYERRDLTMDLFVALAESEEFRDWPHLGTVVQAYLRDAGVALERMEECARRRGTPLTVRLVKGAYWDYEVIRAKQENWPVPVWTKKWESDVEYERLTRRVLQAAPHLRTAIASHNVRSIAHAVAQKEALGVGDEHFECQTLFGMGDGIKVAIADLGVPVRVYLPYGPLIPGMGYLVRRLLENTANESFLKSRVSGEGAMERLLARPGPARPA